MYCNFSTGIPGQTVRTEFLSFKEVVLVATLLALSILAFSVGMYVYHVSGVTILSRVLIAGSSTVMFGLIMGLASMFFQKKKSAKERPYKPFVPNIIVNIKLPNI